MECCYGNLMNPYHQNASHRQSKTLLYLVSRVFWWSCKDWTENDKIKYNDAIGLDRLVKLPKYYHSQYIEN